MKNISQDEVEVFLFYETEMSLQMVRDLIEPQGGNKIDGVDRETRNLAKKIKNCPHYRIYAQSYGPRESNNSIRQ